MTEDGTITAHLIGNPHGGELDNPWPPGHPAVGERVAIFAHEVLTVDGGTSAIRRYHVAPADLATEGPVGSEGGAAQGITTTWSGCGAGTVAEQAGPEEPRQCRVRADDPALPAASG